MLIAGEGIDGSGKTTQLAHLADWLETRGHAVVRTREPTDGPMGQRIRAMARSGETVAPEEELRWFLADREAHVREVVAPALAAGRVVVTDRYTLSSVAYQGARGLDAAEILAESEKRFPLPDLVLLFELAPAEALARIEARGGIAEPSFEQHPFLERVSAVFATLRCPYLERVDARGDPDAIWLRVREAVERRLGLL